MTEVWQGPTLCVCFRGVCFKEVSVKRELSLIVLIVHVNTLLISKLQVKVIFTVM